MLGDLDYDYLIGTGAEPDYKNNVLDDALGRAGVSFLHSVGDKIADGLLTQLPLTGREIQARANDWKKENLVPLQDINNYGTTRQASADYWNKPGGAIAQVGRLVGYAVPEIIDNVAVGKASGPLGGIKKLSNTLEEARNFKRVKKAYNLVDGAKDIFWDVLPELAHDEEVTLPADQRRASLLGAIKEDIANNIKTSYEDGYFDID